MKTVHSTTVSDIYLYLYINTDHMDGSKIWIMYSERIFALLLLCLMFQKLPYDMFVFKYHPF